MHLRRLVESGPFNAFIVAVILLNAGLIGLSTYTADPGTLALIAGLEWVCIGVFIVELTLRFLARRSSAEFFRNGWNLFDLAIIGAAFIPASNGVGPALRILRVFRVLRLVKTIPELRLIVNVLARSVVSMKHVALLAAILFYVYAVIGVKLFGSDGGPLAPHFASIHEACFTLFRILTGDDWTQLRYDLAQSGRATAGFTAYQVSWIVIATFLLVNLIVGAVINNYQKVQDIEQNRLVAPDTSERRLRELVAELSAILEQRERAGPVIAGPSPPARPGPANGPSSSSPAGLHPGRGPGHR